MPGAQVRIPLIQKQQLLKVMFLFCFQSLVEQLPSDDPDTEINLGCLLFKVSRVL